MKRLNMSVLGISEIRWSQSGKCIIYEGKDSTQHRNAVPIIVNKEVTNAVLNFTPISELFC